MKTRSSIIQILFVSALVSFGIAGCSSMQGQGSSGKELAAAGPTIMNAHAEPSTVELSRDLRPLQPAQVVADVKDFRSRVTDVRLKFQHVPLTVPMQKLAGTTWRAEITPQQLQMLAVSGKTISYDAVVIAQDENGQIAQSSNPISVSVKAPDIARVG